MRLHPPTIAKPSGHALAGARRSTVYVYITPSAAEPAGIAARVFRRRDL